MHLDEINFAQPQRLWKYRSYFLRLGEKSILQCIYCYLALCGSSAPGSILWQESDAASMQARASTPHFVPPLLNYNIQLIVVTSSNKRLFWGFLATTTNLTLWKGISVSRLHSHKTWIIRSWKLWCFLGCALWAEEDGQAWGGLPHSLSAHPPKGLNISLMRRKFQKMM